MTWTFATVRPPAEGLRLRQPAAAWRANDWYQIKRPEVDHKIALRGAAGDASYLAATRQLESPFRGRGGPLTALARDGP